MKQLILAIIFVFFTTGNIVVAKNLSKKPDWEEIADYSVNLSGSEVNYRLPGALSGEFPQIKGTNANIYDSLAFGNKRYIIIAESFWHYQSKKFFFSDTLGTLEFRLAVFKMEDETDSDIRDEQVFKKKLKYFLDSMKSVINNPLDEVSTTIIGANKWLSYFEVRRPGNPGRKIYALPISGNRYIEVAFSIMIGDDQNRSDWYKLCLKDIEKIMRTFSVSIPD